MPRGRPAKPVEMHLHLGNPSKRNRKGLLAAAKDADPPAVSADEVPAPPFALSLAEAEMWRRLFRLLSSRRTVKATDHEALARYVRYAAVWADASAGFTDKRMKSGKRLTYRTAGGREYIRAGWRLMIEAEARMLALEREFGLTPSSRAAVVARMAETADPVRPPLSAAKEHAGQAKPAPPLAIGALAPSARSKPN